MKIVTGGVGFINSRPAESFSKDGFEVAVFDNLRHTLLVTRSVILFIARKRLSVYCSCV